MHQHQGSVRQKVIKIKGDKYFQSYKICSEDGRQFDLRLTEIRKDSWSVRA